MGHKHFRQCAAKSFDPDVGRWQRLQDAGLAGIGPRMYFDARLVVGGGRHPGEGRGIVHPQAHTLACIAQLARQPPAHAQITVVVDDGAEDVPELASLHAAIVAVVFTDNSRHVERP